LVVTLINFSPLLKSLQYCFKSC